MFVHKKYHYFRKSFRKNEDSGRGQWASLYDGSNFVANPFHSDEEVFGRAELQKHIEPNGDVVGIISNEKAYDFFVLAVVEL